MVACNWLCIERGNFGGRAVWERLVAVNKQGIVFVTATLGEKKRIRSGHIDPAQDSTRACNSPIAHSFN